MATAVLADAVTALLESGKVLIVDRGTVVDFEGTVDVMAKLLTDADFIVTKVRTSDEIFVSATRDIRSMIHRDTRKTVKLVALDRDTKVDRAKLTDLVALAGTKQYLMLMINRGIGSKLPVHKKSFTKIFSVNEPPDSTSALTKLTLRMVSMPGAVGIDQLAEKSAHETMFIYLILLENIHRLHLSNEQLRRVFDFVVQCETFEKYGSDNDGALVQAAYLLDLYRSSPMHKTIKYLAFTRHLAVRAAQCAHKARASST